MIPVFLWLMWQEFFTAIALLLVIEGILPFLNPRGFRDTMRQIAELDEALLRKLGLMAMLLGLILLYLVR